MNEIILVSVILFALMLVLLLYTYNNNKRELHKRQQQSQNVIKQLPNIPIITGTSEQLFSSIPKIIRILTRHPDVCAAYTRVIYLQDGTIDWVPAKKVIIENHDLRGSAYFCAAFDKLMFKYSNYKSIAFIPSSPITETSYDLIIGIYKVGLTENQVLSLLGQIMKDFYDFLWDEVPHDVVFGNCPKFWSNYKGALIRA